MNLMEFKSNIKYPLYIRLAMLPSDEADKITNAKTGGGRCLNAIHDSNLSSSEKHLLLFLGSQMNFTKNFVNQYRHISLNKIAEKISMTKQSILNLLNGYKKKGNKIIGLIEKGYVNKLIASKEDQEKGWANHYCLTSKIFDEYMETMINEYNEGSQSTPSQTVLPPQSNSFTPPSQTVLLNVPSIHNPSNNPLNADPASAAAAVKKERKLPWKPSSKRKTWEQKSEEEKTVFLLERIKTMQRTAIDQKTAAFFDFNNILEVILAPMIKTHGLEAIKAFLDENKTQGCDVRRLPIVIRNAIENGRKKEEMNNLVREDRGIGMGEDNKDKLDNAQSSPKSESSQEIHEKKFISHFQAIKEERKMKEEHEETKFEETLRKEYPEIYEKYKKWTLTHKRGFEKDFKTTPQKFIKPWLDSFIRD